MNPDDHLNSPLRRRSARAIYQARVGERRCEDCDYALPFQHLGVAYCARKLEDNLPPIAVARRLGSSG